MDGMNRMDGVDSKDGVLNATMILLRVLIEAY